MSHLTVCSFKMCILLIKDAFSLMMVLLQLQLFLEATSIHCCNVPWLLLRLASLWLFPFCLAFQHRMFGFQNLDCFLWWRCAFMRWRGSRILGMCALHDSHWLMLEMVFRPRSTTSMLLTEEKRKVLRYGLLLLAEHHFFIWNLWSRDTNFYRQEWDFMLKATFKALTQSRR